jgi:undecaprenyl diphosphate synthase
MQTWNKLSDIPQHIAVIMDGNRRWARERGLPDIAGHYAGAKRIRSVVQSCSALGVEFLTIFAFSTENWKRSKTEVSVLLGLLRRYLEVDAKDLGRHGVRLKIIGNHALFDARTQNLINKVQHSTQNNNGLTLTIAVNYGGRWDIVQAAKAWQAANPELGFDSLTESDLSTHLGIAFAPTPQLLIRTGGESRLSNFMLWQLANAEMFFCDCFWPDFSEMELHKAIDHFCALHARNRTLPDQTKAA